MQQVTQNRDRYMKRVKEKYPDKEYADDEALFSQINEDYDGYEHSLEEYKGREKSLTDLFASNPRSAAFLNDWRNGQDPIVNLIRKYGGEIKDALDDPEKAEAIAEANKEYAERIAKEEEYEEQYQANIEETMANIEALQQEKQMSDDDIDKALDLLIGIMRDGLLGKFSKESIMMAMKAINHDSDVMLANREGEVMGRNAKIEERLRKGRTNDGTANLAGRNGGLGDRNMPELGVLEQNYGSKNIWERGGEKRKSFK